jgi:O-antigen ligase
MEVRIFVTLAVLVVLMAGVVIWLREYFATTLMRLELLQIERGEVGRLERFRVAWDVISRFPEMLMGLGIGGFSVAYAGFDDYRGDYPHNVFLEVGSELGAIGVGALAAMVLWSFVRAQSNMRRAASIDEGYTANALLALLAFSLVNASISGDVNDNRFLFAVMGTVSAYESGGGRRRAKG